MSSGYVDLNGGRHYYEFVGEGSPIVLIPGYTLDTRMWDDQFDVFAARHRVLRYDLPGTGRSTPPSAPYSYYEDLKALLNFLEIPRAHIVGLSLGGAIAVEFALAYPDVTLSLIPVDTSALGGYPWHPDLDPWFAAISAAATRGNIEAAKEHWLSTGWFVPALKNPEVSSKLRRIVSDYSGWHFQNKNPVQNLTPPPNERLGEILAPTLVIVGELDVPFYNLPIADMLTSGISGAQKMIIPDVGHMSNMEDPARFNEAVLSFVDTIDGALGRAN